MTNEQIALVQQSWSSVLPVAREAGLIFYKKLFAASPGVRHLFKQDVREQADKLVMMLGYIVANLSQMDKLLPDVQRLAERHAAYGAQPAHYEAVGQCLLATLKEGLGKEWTPEVQDAWLTAYNKLKNVMIVSQTEAGISKKPLNVM